MVLLKSGASLHLEGPGQGTGGEGISPRSELLPLWLLPIYHHQPTWFIYFLKAQFRWNIYTSFFIYYY